MAAQLLLNLFVALVGEEPAHFCVTLIQREVDDLQVLDVDEFLLVHDVHDLRHQLLFRPDEHDALRHQHLILQI